MSTLNPKPLEPNAPITWDHYPPKGAPITRTGTVWCPAPAPAQGTTRVLWVIPDTPLPDDLYAAIPVGRSRTDHTPAHGQDHADLVNAARYARGEARRLTNEGPADEAAEARKTADSLFAAADVADLHRVNRGTLYSSGYTHSPLGQLATAVACTAREARASHAKSAA